ncbi:SusC/RagA family TonB-linked outer membrane protein [Olivibacter domesticus]|uniref:TonB-linked outer membrane protein, SusC/RagA family n=1 Tax=Olivibacter domesticus TaxID=407022 RepID=A0A1H7J8V1_OLID1|nr:SusC/RagA family TonB-linked outer membrane protein [Olivibacter domesticus]SEK70784.1 TonB-linked outer membrane protein, SusC/RagA family [Olivibacter domesticus]
MYLTKQKKSAGDPIAVKSGILAKSDHHVFPKNGMPWEVIKKARYPIFLTVLACSQIHSLAAEPKLNVERPVYSSVMLQDRIMGKVVDGQNAPLSGVSIAVKGTTLRTQTDENGNFSLGGVPKNGIIVASYLGYATKEIATSGQTLLTIQLASRENALDEVVVVAYGSINKALATGSSGKISAELIEKRPITNALSSIAGSAPGVQSTTAGGAPGASPSIRIRGFGSLSAENGALIVLDGAAFEGDMAGINPDDIESISVLKDAATTAMYGSRGANGVVLITTKKGKIDSKNLNVKASKGWISRGLPEYDRVTATQYYPLMWETYRNSLAYGSARIPRDVAGSIAAGLTTEYNGRRYSGINSLLGYNPFNVPDNQIVNANGELNPNAQLLYPDDLNWEEQSTQGGKQRQNYNLSYSGGSSSSDYYGSFGYTDEEGYLVKSSLKRYTARLSVNTQPLDFFKTGLNVSGNYSKAQYDNVGDGGTGYINPFYISRFIGPIYPVHLHDETGALVLDANGQPRYDFGDNRPFAPGRHTIYENLMDAQNQVRGQVNARAYGTVFIVPGLKATTNISFDLLDTHNRTYDNPTLGDGAPSGRAYQYFYRTTSYTFNQLIEYTKSFGKHNLNVLAGHENYSYKYNNFNGSRSGLIAQGITELDNFATVLGLQSYEHNATIESYLSRVNYDYDGKYIFSGSLRRDGNSKFAPGVRWANFWSLSAAWNIDREDFFDVDWVDQLKFRTSYGTVGNDRGGDAFGYYPYQALYLLGRNNQSEAGFTQNSLPNEELTWETAKNFDAGIDFSFFKGRLGGSLEFFNRETSGLIFAVPQPMSNGGNYLGSSEGYFKINSNIGNLYNRGVELQLTGQIVNTGDFKYSATLNWTTFKNEITKMPDNQPLIQDGTKAYSVGHSVYDFYMRRFYGVDPDNGEALYYTNQQTNNTRIIGQDTVTNQIAEANYTYTGESAIPDFHGAMSHNFSCKNFSLFVQFTYQVGGKVYDNAYRSLMHGGTYGTAMHVDALKRWQNPGDITDVPRLDNGQVANYAGISDRFLTDASYFQLNTVSLSYSIPKKWLNHLKAQNANIYCSAENLALWTKRKGMNTVGAFNGTVDNTYNLNRIVSVGVNLTF